MAGNATAQQAVLNALGAGDCLTIDCLSVRLTLTRKQISTAAARLIARGWLERVEAGCFRLTPAGRDALAAGTPITSGPRGKMTRRRPVRDSLCTRLWRAMRLLKKFGLAELLELAARDEKNPKHGAQRYVTGLAKAGYLLRHQRRSLGTAPTSPGHVRWTLIRDTGDLPPMLRRGGRVVFDPNTGEDNPCQTTG